VAHGRDKTQQRNSNVFTLLVNYLTDGEMRIFTDRPYAVPDLWSSVNELTLQRLYHIDFLCIIMRVLDLNLFIRSSVNRSIDPITRPRPRSPFTAEPCTEAPDYYDIVVKFELCEL